MNPPVKQRVMEERSELNARLGKLNSFMGTAPFYNLSMEMRELLEKQRAVMQQYRDLLDSRLKLM